MGVKVMKTISKIAIAFSVLVGVIVILANQSVDAVPLPTDNEYVVGPFEAVGFGATLGAARGDAWFELIDQYHGPGGHVEILLEQGLQIVSLNIGTQGYDSPEYTIVYTLTVCGPNAPIDNPGNEVP